MRRLLRLLSDPTRLRILAAVASEELAVNEIADTLAMGQSRISNHLRLLKAQHALHGRRDGSWTFYRNALRDDPDRAAIWSAVASGLEDDPQFVEDHRRRSEVLERRRRRSRAHFAGHAAPVEYTLGTVREEILAALAPRDTVVVDAGCGDGYLTEVLAERFSEVWAIDHAPERLAAARARVRKRHVRFQLGEIDALPLPARSCDAVFLSFVLHHAPEVGAALGEARRVLKPGGRVVVADLLPHEEESLREREGDLRLGLDTRALRSAIVAAGFDDVSVLTARDRWIATSKASLPIFVASGQRPRAASRSKNKSIRTSKRHGVSK